MSNWQGSALIAALVFAAGALPPCSRAQAVSDGATFRDSPPAERVDAADSPANSNSARPSSADSAALPAWPPPSTSLKGRFKEDLSKPLRTKEKLTRALEQAIFPGILGTAVSAGIGMATDTRLDHDYGMGARGYLRRWASAFGDNAVGIFVGDFAMASLLHQDPRYHPSKRRGFGHRLGHALAAVFVAQSDTGKNQFNVAHMTGVVVGSGASTAWQHASDRRADYFGERVGTELAGSAGYNIVAEFLFHRKEPRQ